MRSYIEARKNYEYLATGLQEKRRERIQLTNELVSIREAQNVNWEEFKQLVVKIATTDCSIRRMDKELDSLYLQRKDLEEMVELSHVNQERLTTPEPAQATDKPRKDLSSNEKLLKLHARSKTISRSNISQRVFQPLPKSASTLKLPVMLSSITRLKSIPSSMVGKTRGLASSQFSSYLELKQRLVAAGVKQLVGGVGNSNNSASGNGNEGNGRITQNMSKLASMRESSCRQNVGSPRRQDTPMDIDSQEVILELVLK